MHVETAGITTMERIIIADDHPLYRDALQRMLAAMPDVECLGAANGLAEALDLLERAGTVHLLILDLRMPGMAGAEPVRDLLRRYPGLRIAIVSGNIDATEIQSLLAQGAAGFLPKTLEPPAMSAALRLILAGAIYVPPDALAIPVADSEPAAPADLDTADLTPREREVLAEIVRGVSNKQIARDLGIAEVTVKLHSRRILEKLGVRNRAAAAALAVARGLVDNKAP